MPVTAQPPAFRSGNDVIDFFGGPAEVNSYVIHQAERYAYLMGILERIAGSRDPGELRLTDCGPGVQTELVRARYPDTAITTVGYDDHLIGDASDPSFVLFDLNDAYHVDRWPQVAEQDLVLLCEVIEHLYTSPVAVIECLGSWLSPGGRIIVQTPNADSLVQRVRTMLGRPRYGRMSGFNARGLNPRHFREYTAAELREVGRQAGLEVESLDIVDYFGAHTKTARAYNVLSRRLPTSMRRGITVVYRKP